MPARYILIECEPFFYPYFTDEETGTGRLSNLSSDGSEFVLDFEDTVVGEANGGSCTNLSSYFKLEGKSIEKRIMWIRDYTEEVVESL